MAAKKFGKSCIASIIIPNYNNETTIAKTLRLLPKKYDIIVIDDASTDDSIKSISKYTNVTLIRNGKRCGAARCRNIGINAARCDKLIFLDSDICIEKNSLDILAKMLDETDICYPKILFEDGKIFHPLMPEEKRYPAISGCFGMTKAAISRLDEPFDEYYSTYLEDSDFFIRCMMASIRARYVPSSVAVHAIKPRMDYSERYYLEVRNLLYGILKFRSTKECDISPFRWINLLKIAVFGAMNFAWFNWHGYDRKAKLITPDNKIFLEKSWRFFPLFTAAVTNTINKREDINKKSKRMINFYNPKISG